MWSFFQEHTAAMIAGLIAVLTSMLSWNWLRQIARIDHLEANKVSREEMNQERQDIDRRFSQVQGTLSLMQSSIDNHMRDDRQIHSVLIDKIETTNVLLARIDGKLDGKVDK